MEIYGLLNQKIREADLVLVGIGSSFQYDWSMLEEDEVYSELVEKVGDRTEFEQFLSFIQYKLLKDKPDSELKDCYNILADKLSGKNYFIVSTTIDDTIYDSNLLKERIVTPCGGFRYLQCDNNCRNELFPLDLIKQKDVNTFYAEKTLPNNAPQLICPYCGKPLVFNQIGAGIYCETDYLEQWSLYTKWLMGTMHKKVVLLELGAGLEFMSIIRNPFEKMVTYNQSAELFRIHPEMAQLFLVDEAKERAHGITSDVRTFLKKWM